VIGPGERRAPTGSWIALGLGGNLGDRLDYLRRGVFALASHPSIRLARVSRVWESDYQGPGQAQPRYLNLVCTGRTDLEPQALLTVVKALEERLDRAPDGHMQPRTLDVDILLYDDLIASDPDLTLPHPRLRERGFVLAPLAEIAADRVLPDSGETAAAAWARIQTLAGPRLEPWPEPVAVAAVGRGGEEDWRAALAVHCR
jgi:2-amino-4-hydroxy-6-hydroxymethyldihydropteridine diphosphokinase